MKKVPQDQHWMALSTGATVLERDPTSTEDGRCGFTGDSAECGPQHEGSSRKLNREVG